MYKICEKYGYLYIFSFIFALFTTDAAAQGFLELPDTSELPEYERESLLLDLDVPPLRDRDPDPEAGPRLNVKEFRLQGLVEYPELGITRERLIKHVESIRFDLMAENRKTDSGYTLDELGELSDLIADIEHETQGKHVGPLEVQKIVFLIREQRRRRGITLGMIETVADTITQFYREKGFILAKAYIPEQEVRDGIVILTLLLGELGEVAITNNKRVSQKLIEKIFKNDIHKPVSSERVEESLYLVNDIPGVTAQSFFSPGSQVGDTLLAVNITSEKKFSHNIRIDNHGSKSTSQNRVYIDTYFNNPLGNGDQLYIAALNTFEPNNSTFGAIRYSSFFFSPRIRASLGYSTNDFVSRDELNIQGRKLFVGESKVIDSSLKYIFKRSRVKNYSASMEFKSIETELETAGANNNNATQATLRYSFDVLNEKRQQLYIGNFALHHISAETLAAFTPNNNDDEYPFFSYDFSFLSFPKIPFTKMKTRLLLKTSGQYAGDTTSNLTQFSLTGPARARAFSVNGLQADDAAYMGLDWIFTMPSFGSAKLFGKEINQVFQPFIFLDGAYGTKYGASFNNKLSDKITAEIANVGVGMKINFQRFSAEFQTAKVISDKAGDVNTPRRGAYFEMQYSF